MKQIRKIILQRKWIYCPHFSSTDMKAGIHKKMHKLQGRNSTYYAGEVACSAHA